MGFYLFNLLIAEISSRCFDHSMYIGTYRQIKRQTDALRGHTAIVDVVVHLLRRANARVRETVRKDVPILSAISATRSPQIPLTATSTLSPGSTALKTAHSMAACPEPLIAIVMLFSV